MTVQEVGLKSSKLFAKLIHVVGAEKGRFQLRRSTRGRVREMILRGKENLATTSGRLAEQLMEAAESLG